MKKLKKITSVLLTAVFMFSAAGTACADDAFAVSYTTPNTKLKKANGQAAGNYIGVNQETIEIGYPKALSTVSDDITLTPEPKGGIVKTIDQNKLILSFGELDENETYTLTIPENSVKATDGTYADAYTDTYKTLSKTSAEDDFSSSAYSAPESGIKNMASGVIVRNKGTLPSFSQKSAGGDKYLTVSPQKGTDFFLGVRAPFDNISTSKIVSRVVFNSNNGQNCEAHNTGSIYGWEPGEGISTEGYPYARFANLPTDENGFYDVTISTSVRSNGMVQSNKISAEYKTEGFSNIDTAQLGAIKTTKSISQSDCKLYSTALVKLYTGKDNCNYEVNISYLKSGYFVIPSPIGKPQWDSTAKTLTYKMNTDIADASSVKIGGLQTEAIIDNESRTLTLSYTGEILSGETYTVNLSDVVSMDGFKGTKNDEYTALTEGIESITPSSGEILGVSAGEIKIMFTSVYNEEDLKSAVSFTDKDGNEPKGGIMVVQNRDNPCEVSVKFGHLTENTEYYLKISELILPVPALYKFKTGDKYIINDDFSSWDTGEIAIENTRAKYFTKNNLVFGFNKDNDLQTSHFEIKEEKGKKYLAYNNTQKDKDIAVGFSLPKSLKSGKIIVEIGVRAGNANGNFANSAFDILPYYGDSVPGSASIMQSSRPRIGTFSDYSKDENGFTLLKIELSKSAVSNGVSTVTAVYRDANNLEKSERVSAKHTTKTDDENVIGSLAFAKIYSNEDAYDAVELAYVRAYYPTELGTVNSLDNFEPKNRTMELMFNEDIAPESLNDNPITVSDGENTITLDLVSYDNRHAVFNLSEHLNYNTSYKLDFSGAKSESGAELITENGISFKTSAKPLEITDINGLSFKVKNNSDGIRSFIAAAVLYNEKGKVIKTVFSGKTSVSTGGTESINIVSHEEYSSYKLIVLDDTDGIIIIK